MAIINRTLAVMPVKDFAAAQEWYERFFGRAPDARPMTTLSEWHEGSGGIAIFEQPEQAGNPVVTLLVDSIDLHRSQLAERGLQLGERQGGDEAGVAQIKDPAGNTINLAQRRAKPETGGDCATVARNFFEAFRDRRKDDLEALMSPDFVFNSPYDDHIGKREYFERCWPNGERFAEMTIERVTPDAEGAYVTYFVTTIEGKSFRNTEYLTVTDGKASAANVFFGESYVNGRRALVRPDSP